VSKKFTGQKKIALSCPVLFAGRPAGQSGQGKKKTLPCRAGQGRAGRQGIRAALTC